MESGTQYKLITGTRGEMIHLTQERLLQLLFLLHLRDTACSSFTTPLDINCSEFLPLTCVKLLGFHLVAGDLWIFHPQESLAGLMAVNKPTYVCGLLSGLRELLRAARRQVWLHRDPAI